MTETAVRTADQTSVTGAVGDAGASTSPPEGDHAGETHDGAPSVAPSSGLIEARDRYRGERDAAREELAGINARVERMQRAEVERLAAGMLAHPSDLFTLTGNEIGDYLTEAGNVDAERVAADVAAVLVERPGLRITWPTGYDPSQGHGGAAAGGKASWSQAFKRRI